MKVIEKIHIPRIDLENQKITEFIELYLEIRDNSVSYTARFYADEPKDEDDKNLGWENVFNSFCLVASKDKISGIEKAWLKESKKWTVYIFVTGFANDIKTYFKRESEAEALYQKLHNWLY